MNEHVEILGLDEVEVQNTAVEELETEVINLIFVGIDQSGSMYSYQNTMEESLRDFKDALEQSKEADEMLVARANFNEYTVNVGGYKKINQFDTDYIADGMTPLYDVITEGTEKLTTYMTYLKEQGMRVKAVFAIFSDGDDTSSRSALQDAKASIETLNKQEITTAFISFGAGAKQEADRLGFKNILNITNSNASELRKAFNCLSKSVIEASKSVVAKDDDFFNM